MGVRTVVPLWLVLALASGPSLAQQGAAEDDATSLETVEVLGSRIKRLDVEGQVPVFTLERKDLERTGVASVGDILQQLTTSGTALSTKVNASGNFGYPPDGGGIGAGSTQIDLRYLESKRVLVLVDGIRWVNESSASGVGGAVDLNTIPLSIVDRIEVLEDGASAIYGSDAIAGVVNVVTRRRYQGVEISAYTGMFEQGDGATNHAQVTWGGGDSDFNLVLSGSYYRQSEIGRNDRELTRYASPPPANATRGSSATPQGLFVFCDPRRTPDCAPQDFLALALDDGTASPTYDPNSPDAPPSTYHDFTPFDTYNFQPFNMLLTPSQRASGFAAANFHVIEGVRGYFKGLYNDRKSVNRAAPEPFFIGGDAGTGGIADTISIPADQPYNPFGIDLNAGENFALIGRRPLEGGPRTFRQNVRTTYVASGLLGAFEWLDRPFTWDMNLAYSINKADQDFENGYNLRRVQQALGDPDACAAIQGCVPLNIFGGQGANGEGTITPDMLDWIRVGQHDASDNQLRLLSANISSLAFDLPAGSVPFAVGYEYRRYDGSYSPDPARVNGESQDSPAQPVSAHYDVNEGFVEVSIPLLARRALAQRLDVSLAGRYSDYSSFGGKATGKFGLRWQPLRDLILRGTYAQGFRAPFIGELYGLTQFAAGLNDPCSNSDGTTLESNCRALGVPAGYQQSKGQIITNTGGNPDLKPESARSVSAGFVYSPSWAEQRSWARRLDLGFTYYNHDIDQAIEAPDAQARLNACVASADPESAVCQGITRTPNGTINRFDNFLSNIGEFKTDGFDLKLNWIGPDVPWGRVDLHWQNTFVHKFRARDVLGVESRRREGAESGDNGIPRLRSNLQLDWRAGIAFASWTVRYISALTEPCTDGGDNTPLSLTNLGLCSAPNAEENAHSTNRLRATVYNDVQAGVDGPLGIAGLHLAVGVRNVLDQEPPTCITCTENFDMNVYDVPGRFGYLTAAYRF